VHARPSHWLPAVALCALGAGSVAAQAPSPPPWSVGVLAYTQFVYQLKDTANHVNNFDVTRAYVNVIGRFSGGLYTRITADIYRNTDPSSAGSLSYRLKYAYAAYTPAHSPLTYKVGLIHTPWLDWEEALWDYRMQGTMALERGGYVSSSDFGVGVDGKWGPDKVNFQLTVVNGENYNRSPGDKGKDLDARVSVRVADTDDSSRVGGLRVTAYGQYGRANGSAERNRLLAMVSYRSKQITLAGQAATTQDGPGGATAGHVYSAFGVYKVPRSKVALLARVDITDLQAGVTDDRRTRIIGGASYQLTPNFRLLADWDYLTFQTDALNAANDATRSQALFQTQIQF
jgi:hypothetical protein